MLATNRDALVCDLAETYHILDITALPVPLLATLAAGLRGNSRVRMMMTGESVTTQEMVEAAMLDRMTTLCWMQSKDGAHGRNRPASVLDAMVGKETGRRETAAEHPVAYDSPDDFNKAWAQITRKAR